jgi:hypothetical protein
MSGFHQVLIGGYPNGGLVTDRKPLMLPDQAYSNLQNAYVWRERTKKRDGCVGIGRLRRVFNATPIGNSPASSTWTFVLYSVVTPAITETYAQIEPGSVVITDGTDTFTDQGNGFLERQDGNLTSTINYITGSITLNRTISTVEAFTASFNYYPTLCAEGICKQDISPFGIENTIFFDTTYAYEFVTGGFQELVPGETWSGSVTNPFWYANYQGSTPDLRFFFVTNNNITLGAPAPYDPIKYYDPGSSSWVDLQPLVTATDTLFQALIVVPYYGRLVALNVWQGSTMGGAAGASNFFARAIASQIGDPTAIDAWRYDIFGKGIFIDAPTNEAIVSAAFFRNTLIVFFEYSTWQLRYIGEYGIPFIFERISSDFGCVSTFSSIVFDQGVMSVGDRGIIEASAGGVKRIDDAIPETVFGFNKSNDSPNFVHGVRDYEKEVVYWNYLEPNEEASQAFPNTVLLFNYRNNTWAKFRDSVTCFGIAQFQFGVNWNSQTTFWEDDISWDSVDDQNYVDYITAGNQQGFIFIYENDNVSTPIAQISDYAPTLCIYAVNPAATPAIFTSPNHNLATGEIIYITNTIWSGVNPGINNKIYRVIVLTANTFTLGLWNGSGYSDFGIDPSSVYIGGGVITLFPKMNIVGKDFNPFQGSGKQYKLSYIDFQMDSTELFPSIPAVTVQLFVNSRMGQQANLSTSNQELLNSPQQANYIQGATQSNPCVITSVGNSLATGQMIYIANVEGMTQLNQANYIITVIDADHFSLNGIDSTGFGAYTSGGIWNTLPTDGQIYIPGSEYAWYRFYSTQFGQYLRIAITYDDELMNQLSTHQTPIELNAMNCWFREGGRLVN